MHKTKNLSTRIWLLDEIRGIDVILMCIYHLLYDLVEIFGANLPIYHTWGMRLFQGCIVGVFVILSGIACRFSKNNTRRGAICFALGMVMTLVTWLVMPSQLIVFGVLHMLGICMVLFGLLRPLLDKIPPLVGAIVSACLFALTYYTQIGQLGIGGFSVALPKAFYETPFLFWLGFPNIGFASADYFPLLPWLFLFICGSFLGVYVKAMKMPRFFYACHSKALALIGRNTLIIYLVHQPIIYGILYIIYSIT